MRSRILATCTSVAAALLATSCSSHHLAPAQLPARPLGPASPTMTIVAAGDIACPAKDVEFNNGRGVADACQQAATARLAASLHPDAVLALGDTQYDAGTPSEFAESYAKSWGGLKPITHPAIGNHEYLTPGGRGYFDYFGAAAGRFHHSWYSLDLGSWHLVALDSNCFVVPCGRGLAQEQWLRRDLRRHARRCTLAYFHHPLFSSGPHGNNPGLADLWDDLYRYRVDVALTGHDHIYERYEPMDSSGTVRPTGVREFVVGTGGKEHYAISHARDHSDVHDDHTFGVLELSLAQRSYTWRFVPVPGATFTDAGRATCH